MGRWHAPRRRRTPTVLAVGATISAYTHVAEVLGSTARARGGLLLLLLVVYGVGAFSGTLVAGPAVDRLGPRRVLLTAVAAQVVPLTHPLVLVVPLVLLWGATTTASTPPQQVRLIALAPGSPTVAVSLNSSAVHVGQSAGAVVGSLALTAGVPAAGLPGVAAGLAAAGLLVALVRAPGDDQSP